MADVLLFHHIQGQTAGFLTFASQLRSAGHDVHAPDLFDGRTFPTIEEGSAHLEAAGFEAFVERGVAAAAHLPSGLVYAGISLGVMPAQKLAQTRAGAHGALLIEACVPPTEFGVGWPDGVPVQIHGMDQDPFFAGEGDIAAAQALVEQAAASTSAELFVYPGDQHLFVDSSLPSYDAAATALVVERVLTFLEQIAA